MEEADALCNKIAIIVNGQLQCFGSPQHLKNKFGRGYILDILLRGDPDKMTELLGILRSEIGEYEMKESHGCHAIMTLPNTKSLSFVFRLLEHNRVELTIVDYTLSQTTLDQIFIQFSKGQREDTEASSVSDLLDSK